MEKEVAQRPTLRLHNTVTRRTVPMTARGCDMLRAIREHQQKTFFENNGVEYDIPFPTSIHLMMTDYCDIKKIKVTPHEPNTGTSTEADDEVSE